MARAVELLRAGEPVIIPTETVYGIAVDPFAPGATDRLFTIKSRPKDVPLPVLVADATQAATLVEAVDEVAGRLMARFWPGPLTLVMRRRPGVDIDLGLESATIGIRCPDHPVARGLAQRVGPIATTSANRHGEPPPGTAAGQAALFAGEVRLVLDAGPCEGLPSTVVDIAGREPVVLRAGPISGEEIAAAAG